MADLKWMLGSDFHIPAHDKRCMELWFKVMRWFKPDIVDYPGDIDDQSCFSKYSDGTPDEVLNRMATYAPDVRQFYQDTRDLLPDAELFVELGNHDIRVWDYIDRKAPAFKDAVTPETMWGLDNLGYGYIYYSDPPVHRYGDIFVHHGDAISQNAGESVRRDVGKFGVSIIRGHSHRIGNYMQTYHLRNQTIRGYEIGHMADIRHPAMSYDNVWDWQPGFMIGYIEQGSSATADGYWPHLQQVHISPDYTCRVGSKIFKA